jgi:hypothetical protein
MITLGTKHISEAFIWSCRLVSSNAFILCSRVANLSRPSSILLRFLHCKINGRRHFYGIYWLSNLGIHSQLRFKWHLIYASRFYRFASIGSGWAVNFSSPYLDPKVYSSRLVSLMTSSLKTFQFLSVLSFQLSSFIVIHSSFSQSGGMSAFQLDLYFNPLNENYAIIHKWWCYQ